MREIKFRAWLPKRGMIKVDLNEQHTDTTEYYIAQRDGTIMQYIGLKDKNGVEIYEGDIVHITKGKKHITARINYTLTYMGYSIGNPKNSMECAKYDDGSYVKKSALHEYVEYMHSNSPYLEVVGNIYQNTELTN